MKWHAEFKFVYPNSLTLTRGYSVSFEAASRKAAMQHCNDFERENFGDFKLHSLKRQRVEFKFDERSLESIDRLQEQGRLDPTPPTPRKKMNNPCGKSTAESFARLAKHRGISAVVEWDDNRQVYVANGEDCGKSVHGLYGWLDRQPGVLP